MTLAVTRFALNRVLFSLIRFDLPLGRECRVHNESRLAAYELRLIADAPAAGLPLHSEANLARSDTCLVRNELYLTAERSPHPRRTPQHNKEEPDCASPSPRRNALMICFRFEHQFVDRLVIDKHRHIKGLVVFFLVQLLHKQRCQLLAGVRIQFVSEIDKTG